jgi:hypothetical protein
MWSFAEIKYQFQVFSGTITPTDLVFDSQNLLILEPGADNTDAVSVT